MKTKFTGSILLFTVLSLCFGNTYAWKSTDPDITPKIVSNDHFYIVNAGTAKLIADRNGDAVCLDKSEIADIDTALWTLPRNTQQMRIENKKNGNLLTVQTFDIKENMTFKVQQRGNATLGSQIYYVYDVAEDYIVTTKSINAKEGTVCMADDGGKLTTKQYRAGDKTQVWLFIPANGAIPAPAASNTGAALAATQAAAPAPAATAADPNADPDEDTGSAVTGPIDRDKPASNMQDSPMPQNTPIPMVTPNPLSYAVLDAPPAPGAAQAPPPAAPLPLPHVASGELSDIEGHWAKNSIVTLAGAGAVGGYPDGTFLPDNSIKIDEFVKIIISMNKIPAGLGGIYWASEYIKAAIAQGWIDIGEFSDYTADITRAEMSRIIVRSLSGVNVSIPADVSGKITDFDSVPDNMKDFVLKAYALGIVNGNPDGSFGPNQTATRAEAVTMLLRMTVVK